MAEAARLHITTRSGRVRVVAEPGAEFAVVDGTAEQQADGTISIRRAPSSSSIEVRCAPGTDLTVGTVSGSIDCTGELGAVRVATVSGAIRIDTVARVDVRAKSGTIDIAACTGECRVMTKSSKVHVGTAGRATVATVSGLVALGEVGGAEIKCVSAKVLLALAPGAGRVSIHTVSGTVEVRVPAATRPATRLRSISGRVQCDVVPGDGAELAVKSVSGPIRVSGP